jgi:signal transduction histidine kinase
MGIQKRHIEYLLWTLFLSALGWGIFNQLSMRQLSSAYLRDAALRFERHLSIAELQINRQLESFNQKAADKTDFTQLLDFWSYESCNAYVFIRAGDSLLFWNNNRIGLDDIRNIHKDKGLARLSNGIFYARNVDLENRLSCLFLMPLRDRYSYENRYLNNEFALKFDGIEGIRMLDADRKGQQVHAPDGEVLFTISLTSRQRSLLLNSHEYDSGIAFLLALAFAVFLFFIKIDEEQLRNKPFRALIEFSGVLVLIRVLFFNYRDKIGLQVIPLFDPQLFASHWLLPSLGDLSLHLAVISLVIVFVYRYSNIYKPLFKELSLKYSQIPLQFISLLIVVLFFLVSLLISRDLVFSSDIPLGLNRFFDFNLYTYIALALYIVIIGINLSSFRFLTAYVLRNMRPTRLVILYLLVMATIAFMFSFTGEKVWLRNYAWLWVVLMFILLVLQQGLRTSKQLTRFLLVSWCLYVGFQLSEALLRKETEQARSLARKIYAPEDRIAVFMLLDLIPKIQQDDLVKRYVEQRFQFDGNFRNRLVYQYFQGYLDRYSLYDLQLQTGQEALIGDVNAALDEQMQFNRFGLIKQFRVNARLGYSIRIPFVYENQRLDTLVVRLLQKTIKPESPFPALLLEGDGGELPKLGNKSFAFYENNLLIQQGGKFPYTRIDDRWQQFEGEFNHIQSDEFWHIVYRPGDLNTVVVSFTAGGWFEILAIAAALYLLAIVSLALCVRAYRLLVNGVRLRLSYRNRIEIALLGSVVLIMMAIGYITITYTVLKNKSTKIELIANRLQDLSTAVEGVLGPFDDNRRIQLNQIASTFAIDFNLYGKDGKLLYSSQSKLFERQLLGELMNPYAYQALATAMRTVHIQDEKIGEFGFIAAYMPLRDNKNELAAFLNMPAFSTEQELRNDLNDYLGSLISIYLILLLLATVLTLWLSERISAPIKLLTQVIERTKEGEQTRMTDWKRQDEIGAMISAYNAMLQKLEDNARLLARSEREMAWREMARQISHEIRNPLTPMKLKLQRLLRDWRENPERFQQNYIKDTAVVLEQIDVLASVASEFSSFANVKVAEKVVFDLRNELKQVAELYSLQATIHFVDEVSASECLIFGDAQQIQRVFQNLVKNGIQAVNEDKKPEISIRLYLDQSKFAVDVKDNGDGIAMEDQQKIFQPNFTTKSSGMGLGLAIVKKILEQNDAEIGFETTYRQGTRFFVRFNPYKPSA